MTRGEDGGFETAEVELARTNRDDGFYRGPNGNRRWRLADSYCGVGPLGVHEVFRGH